MNILGVTQGSNLRVFLRLVELLRQRRDIERVGAFVADSMTFKSLRRSEAGLQKQNLELLKEWEIVGKGRTRTPDWSRLAAYERELGDPVFWNTLMADRRVFYGRRCKMRQDYRPRFSFAQMSGILQTAVEEIDAFIGELKPDLIIGFGTSTIGDYLFYRFAKSRDIPYLQLKATKVWNRVALNDDAVELSAHIAQAFNDDKPIPGWAIEEAQRFLASTREKGVRYEGAIARDRRFALTDSLMAVVRGLAIDLKRFLDAETRHDNHNESLFLTYIYERFLNPVKGHWIAARLRRHIIDGDSVATHPPFAFFPLHFEPEVSLQVFGRPYQNQIEVVRALASSLPAGMCLLVKEHPRARGFRPMSYYRKLLDIPNVRLVDMSLPTHLVVRYAALVAIISGSTGLEAAICGRPVLTFGTPVFNVLHGGMIRHVTDLNRLGWVVRDLLDTYRYDESLLQRYIAATVAGSVAVDLYTVLLGKTGRMSEGREDMSKEGRRERDYLGLTDYCDRRINEVFALKSPDRASAP